MRRFGRFIDPAVELPFRFDGAPMRGFAGDTILSALWRNQERAFSRSFKLRRWRGPFSLAADDGATMIDIEGEPNVVAATRPLTANLEIKSRQRAGAVSRLLSASIFGRSLAAPLLRPGFYHRAFFRAARRVAAVGARHSPLGGRRRDSGARRRAGAARKSFLRFRRRRRRRRRFGGGGRGGATRRDDFVRFFPACRRRGRALFFGRERDRCGACARRCGRVRGCGYCRLFASTDFSPTIC